MCIRHRHQGGRKDRPQHPGVKSGAQREEKQHQKEIAQRSKAVGDVQRNRTGRQRHTANKCANRIRQAQQGGDLGKAQTPADGDQENVLADFVETANQRNQHIPRDQISEAQQRWQGDDQQSQALQRRAAPAQSFHLSLIHI